ncbi:MAG: 30S ribosomal protein S12 methylthiotransferase RimO [Clostridia bacterium]
MKVGMISLGCDKNRIDSENMLFTLANAGFEIVQDKNEAEIIIINTCAFIELAKIETIDTIFEMAKLKENNLKYLVVTGCFANRYGSNIELPEVDLWISIDNEKDVVKLLHNLTNTQYEKQEENEYEFTGRILTTPNHYAYLKISDGCDKRCSYCAIPNIRGKYISRPMAVIIEEAKYLIGQGVKEIILVAQDTSSYGKDLYGKNKLVELLEELVLLDVWKIRLLYVYPEEISDRLIDFVGKEEKMAKYFDMPLQHINDSILTKMNRKSSREKIENIISKIRNTNSDIAIRSTFIVGFPYETHLEHTQLVDFVTDKLDYAGFFEFSKEEGTPAYNFPDGIDKKTCELWRIECEEAQCNSTIEHHQKYINKVVEVIYEDIDYDKQMFVGRTEQNAPEIDTNVFFTSAFPLEIGQIYKVLITKTDFNMYGNTVL